uniref:Uncharacterized protein n=1 Tax=viral metagenome TaxID=1070528 RepID=A0A6C0DS97_9ZZZZ
MASSLKRKSGTGISGAVSTLLGAHKNPAKHVVLRLLEVLDSEELGELPEVIAQANEALAMLEGNNAPANARNPFYKVVLSTFLDVSKDRIAHSRGRLSGADAIAREELFEFTRQASMRAFTALPPEMGKKPDVARIGELLFAVAVKTKGFYRAVTSAAKKAMTEAEQAEAKAKSNARMANLRARMEALGIRGGRRGATRRRATRRRATRRGATRRRSRY